MAGTCTSSWLCHRPRHSPRDSPRCPSTGRVPLTWIRVRNEHPGCHVAGGVRSDLVCDDRDGARRAQLGKAQGGGEPHHAGPHHGDLGPVHGPAGTRGHRAGPESGGRGPPQVPSCWTAGGPGGAPGAQCVCGGARPGPHIAHEHKTSLRGLQSTLLLILPPPSPPSPAAQPCPQVQMPSLLPKPPGGQPLRGRGQVGKSGTRPLLFTNRFLVITVRQGV